MSDELIKLFEFDWDTSQPFPNKKFEEVISTKFPKVKIVVNGDPESAVQNSGIDYNLYSKIKSIQGLPGDVVIRFLNSKGSITSKKFKDRTKF